jgi:hypothetical protein
MAGAREALASAERSTSDSVVRPIARLELRGDVVEGDDQAAVVDVVALDRDLLLVQQIFDRLAREIVHRRAILALDLQRRS